MLRSGFVSHGLSQCLVSEHVKCFYAIGPSENQCDFYIAEVICFHFSGACVLVDTSVICLWCFSEPSPSCAFCVVWEDCPSSCESTLCKMQRLIVKLSVCVSGLRAAMKIPFSVLHFCSADLIL